MYAGTRTFLTFEISARRIVCLIHQEAYVLNLQPSSGLNRSTDLRSPMFPSSIRSSNDSPLPT